MESATHGFLRQEITVLNWFLMITFIRGITETTQLIGSQEKLGIILQHKLNSKLNE